MDRAPSLLAAIMTFAFSWHGLRILFFLFVLLFAAAIFPYLNWRAFLSARAIRTTIRGGVQYIFGRRGQHRVHGFRLLYKLRMEVMLRTRNPITGINRFPRAKVWVDREAFPRIKKLIARARHTVVIQMFIWKDDTLGREMADLLVRVADRGVNVEISKEAVGDVFEMHKDFLGTKNDKDGVWKRFWTHPRIRVLYETRNDHAKVYIIDDRIFLLTGMNIADESHSEWHDYLVELHGHAFVEHYLTEGDVANDRGEARIVLNTERRKEIRPVVTEFLDAATRSIVIEHCYFSDAAVLDQLIRRSHEGIRIVIILPHQKDFHHYANMQAISRLLAEGARKRIFIFLYPRVIHGKVIMIDRERAFIGSANLMTSSLDEMGEVNVLLEGRMHGAIRKLREVLRDDILQSEPVSRPPRFQWLWRWLTWLKL